MSPTVEELVARAWSALWREGSPYYLPNALQHGRLSGHVRVRPLPSLPLPDVSDVVLLDRAPWGGVTLSLRDSALAGLPSARGVDYRFDPSSGILTARLAFSGLRCTGDYLLQAGHQTGAAVATALTAMRASPPGTQAVSTATTSSDNIALAKTYQSQLIAMESDNGRIMVATYYQNNDTYAELFQLPSFVQVWSSHTTGGQTTKYYAAQTSNAAQPGNVNTVSVNGQPDAEGRSPYNEHSYFMQNYVMATCYQAASHYGTATELGRRYTRAGDDAVKFSAHTKPQSQTGQTVSQVLSNVQTATPNAGTSQELTAAAEASDPQWLKDVRTRAQAMAQENFRKDMVEGGIDTAARARPTRGVYAGPVPEVVLTLVGSVEPDGPRSAPWVTFTRAESDTFAVDIVLDAVAAPLGAEVEGALRRARFLARLLGHRAASALTGPTLLRYVSRQMRLALAQRLGATGH